MNDEAIPETTGRKCGFVAVLGPPNAGKSTLVNALIGAKVSIVSRKSQTTRVLVRGIALVDKTQLVFIDTPGVFSKNTGSRLERTMIASAWKGAFGADSVMVVLDARRGVDKNARDVVRRLKNAGVKDATLALNKIDIVPRHALLPLTRALYDEGVFAEVFMLSALRRDGVGDLLRHCVDRAATGEWMFPEDEISDAPQRMLAAELTREKIFEQLHDELPYSIAVETDAWHERADGSVWINQSVYVLRNAQKAIVLGRNGTRMRAIGAAARHELEELLERRIHLFLRVNVKKNWTENQEFIRRQGAGL